MHLLVGLGNPGIKYAKTRHNVGFLIVSELADKNKSKFKNAPKLNSHIAEIKQEKEKIILALPLTYMNDSGLAVSKISNFYKISSEKIIVIHDDIDLPFGKLRVSFGSSHGGHNGIKSIINSLGTKKFIRLRVGIANTLSDSRKIPSEKFVLQNFSASEQKALINSIPEYINAIGTILKEGHERAMSEFN